jgi:putative SOS response-associated peptidase YedK
MCVQYLTTTNTQWVKTHFGLSMVANPAHDVFPSYPGPIILKGHQSGRIAIGMARFGLIPSWAKEESFGRKTYNARSETVADKPSYRYAWQHCHLALAIVDSFYEPCYESGKAVRTRIRQVNQAPMGIASIWDTWNEPNTGERIVSFSMLTINADQHPLMSRMHQAGEEKRSVVPLRPELFEDWLNAGPDFAMQLLSAESMPALEIA